jgi:uncharacterized protein (DUF2236 family)
MALPRDPRQAIRSDIETIIGRHDERAVYDGPAGDPGLTGGPGSISWEINGDLASVLSAGMAAIIMEVLHPSVMAGVFQQSSYETQPLRRARNTLGYVMRTTFGNTEAATAVIERVKKVHSRIEGTRPDGIPYRALDPELIAWVHTCIPWAVMEGFARYRRPLTTAERDQYLREQAPIGRLGGADWVPETMAELDEYVERMRPLMSMNEQLTSFMEFVTGAQEGPFQVGRMSQAQKRSDLAASMTLMPTWAQKLTGTYRSPTTQRLVLLPSAHLQARLIRWAYPEPPCKAIAVGRATARSGATV